MKCTDVKKGLKEFAEKGTISGEAKKHIASCKKCMKEYKAVKAMRAVLSGPVTHKAGREINRGVWEKLGEASPSVLDNFMPAMHPLAKAAAALLVIFVLLFLAKDIAKETPVEMTKIDRPEPAPVKVSVKDVNEKIKIPVIEIIEKKEALVPEVAANKQPAPSAKNKIPEAAESRLVFNAPQMAVNGSAPAPSGSGSFKSADSGSRAAASVSKEPCDKITPVETVEGKELTVKKNIIRALKGEKITLKYRTDSEARVIIIVYDRQGDIIRTLVREKKPAGMHEVCWDGKEDSGRIAGDGIYIIYVKTDLVEEKIKAVVVK